VFRDIYKAYLPRDYAVEDYYTQAESLRADKGGRRASGKVFTGLS
jgi:hypothetical protein